MNGGARMLVHRATGALFMEKRKATSDYWDAHWNIKDLDKAIRAQQDNPLIVRTTAHFLDGGRVLEGGCGYGGNVFCLREHGYEAVGVDYAERTVTAVNEAFPGLALEKGDVRALRFPDGYFDGYWSLGVIEHFPEGFNAIITEMARVVRSGGYVFLTYPFLSPLRRLKLAVHAYPYYDGDPADTEFYQFFYARSYVAGIFERYGFSLEMNRSFDGVKGFKDEVPLFRPQLQKIYTKRRFRRYRRPIDAVLRPFASHMALQVFRKA